MPIKFTVPDVSSHDLWRLFDYDKATGLLSWKSPNSPAVRVGQRAGTLHSSGYLRVNVHGSGFSVHRLVWCMHTGEWPVEQIDHINGNKADNRVENLRLASAAQQVFNRPKTWKNASGVKGVAPCSKTKNWRAYIVVNGKQVYLGGYRTVEAAAAARVEAEKKYQGEFRCTR